MKTKRDAPTWFTDILAKAEKKSGSRAALARRLKIPPQTIMGWETGAVPGLDYAEAVMKIAGLDLPKMVTTPESKPYAKPDLEPTVVYEEQAHYELGEVPQGSNIFIAGQVAAGKVTFAGEDQHFKTVDSLWAQSRYWGLTTGDVIFLEVHGESMEPEYHAGEVIACRQPTSPLELPNGTPCIFQEGEEDGFTFKLLGKAPGNLIIGQPINVAFDFIVFSKKEVRIPLVVLGKVQLEKRSLPQALAEPIKKAAKKQK